jgi:hypothetical protein
MSKKYRKNPQADIKNPNKGTSGTNKTWDKTQGNKGKQMNPNQKSQPNKQLPKCPICQVPVKANNMEHHLLNVHEFQGNIDNVRQEHNIYKDDQKGMKIHINFSVDNLEEVDCRIAAYFSFQGGEQAISGVSDDFITEDGQAVVEKCFSPPYESTRYNDLQLFMPYEELYLAESYHHHCQFEIQIYINNTNVVIAKSQPYGFSYKKSIHCVAEYFYR